jgi:two-component system sensor histidine kinase KdpD
VRSPLLNRIFQFGAALGIIAATTAFYRKTPLVNVTTVALTFLLAVLVVSTLWGLTVSVPMSLVAVLAVDYFFLPPIGSLTVADPQDWMVLFAFLAVAVIGSHLAARARQQVAEASARQRVLEKLCAFSRDLLESGNVMELMNRIPAHIVNTFEVGAAALFLLEKQKVYRSGPVMPQLDTDILKSVMVREAPLIDIPSCLCFVPVRLGLRDVGSLGISGRILPWPTLESIATLVALAMEHARDVEQLAQTEAARQGEKLRTALLDAVTHALRTPLTSIKASVTDLLSNQNLGEEQRQELLTVINEETDRLKRLAVEAGEMARLDAGEVELDLKPHPLEELIDASLEHCRGSLANRTVEVHVAKGLPQVWVDLARAREVLVNLIDNANKYSPANQPITITAEASGDTVTVSVTDRGEGINDHELERVFEKFYRGKNQRYNVEGTGMGLPIAKAIVEALGGSISLRSQQGHGSVFSFTLPVNQSRPVQT